MAANVDYELYCPTCKKKADAATPMFIRYSFQHLILPIFLCTSCRTVYIDKPTIRRLVGGWRKDSVFTKDMPFKKLYQEFFEELDKMIETYWIPRLGYKRMKFLRRSATKKPR